MKPLKDGVALQKFNFFSLVYFVYLLIPFSYNLYVVQIISFFLSFFASFEYMYEYIPYVVFVGKNSTIIR